MSEQQTFANHRRFDPSYHFFFLPVILLAALTSAGVLAWRPSLHHALLLLAIITVAYLALMIRLYALRVQDRLIRLEESLRMQRLFSADLQARIPELSPNQMVGLRFASDGELAERVREALNQDLSGEAIKKRIQTWRPDTFRV
jgi:hypothetical protein